jgi:hypothetical protein
VNLFAAMRLVVVGTEYATGIVDLEIELRGEERPEG